MTKSMFQTNLSFQPWPPFGLFHRAASTLPYVLRLRQSRLSLSPDYTLALKLALRPVTFARRLALIATLLFLSPLQIALGQNAREVAKQSFPSVVLLVMEDSHSQPVSLGSGFFVSEQLIATNKHVIAGATRGYAKLLGLDKKYDLSGVVGIDGAHDLALLSVPGARGTSLVLGNSEEVQVADEVYAVGNPQGLEGTFSQGIVSGIRQLGTDTILQITAPISPGSSGGPVLNTKGRVIGVAAATFKLGQNLNFAIPSKYLERLLSNTAHVRPLSAVTEKGDPRSRSILDGFGSRSARGMIGTQFSWKATNLLVFYGDFSFSLRNQLRDPVKDVRYLIVFFDRTGNPIEYVNGTFMGTIPPGLATRVSDFQTSVDESVRRLTARIEIRVLDFKLSEAGEN